MGIKKRESNLELFRILLMLMIIAHHYVVNSEIADFFNPTHPTANMLFMTLYGWGGKTGINCFVLVSMFLFFKDLKMKNNRWINKIATATFGVLLIHGNSDAMREWLWGDVLKNESFYNSSYMWLHALLSVLLVYLVCVAIDLLRIQFVEKPIFKAFDSRKSSRLGNE